MRIGTYFLELKCSRKQWLYSLLLTCLSILFLLYGLKPLGRWWIGIIDIPTITNQLSLYLTKPVASLPVNTVMCSPTILFQSANGQILLRNHCHSFSILSATPPKKVTWFSIVSQAAE